MLRAAISDICILGKKPQEVAVELMEFGCDLDADTIRRGLTVGRAECDVMHKTADSKSGSAAFILSKMSDLSEIF